MVPAHSPDGPVAERCGPCAVLPGPWRRLAAAVAVERERHRVRI